MPPVPSPQIVCYIYFTRIIAFLLKLAVPFQWKWLYQVPPSRLPSAAQMSPAGSCPGDRGSLSAARQWWTLPASPSAAPAFRPEAQLLPGGSRAL